MGLGYWVLGFKWSPGGIYPRILDDFPGKMVRILGSYMIFPGKQGDFLGFYMIILGKQGAILEFYMIIPGK
ncbi:hypothetical protein A4H97_16850 [Niastella yeongjuensis]|uniref:Uncharacterized protein n=1 Tax=Niastella yeongjuensis TaxID=354355 RepID=A0A1V9E183_9BACT|nr:hypothetical protein A4H97_16850 [Niastella yeongjuensis]